MIFKKIAKKGLPWEIAKGFDGSAQISNKFIKKDTFLNKNISFCLKKIMKSYRLETVKKMIFSFEEIISYVSKFFTLKLEI